MESLVPELEIPSRKISLDRSFGHPVRTIGDARRHRDDGLLGKPNRTRTGFAVRVDKEAEPTRQCKKKIIGSDMIKQRNF